MIISSNTREAPRTDPDAVHRQAKRAASRGESLEAACPWPFSSWEGQLFKEVFVMHRAALAALGLDDKSLTPD